MPWDQTAPDLEVVGRRARALYALDRSRPVVVVASARALMRVLPPQGSHVFEPLSIVAGGTLDLAQAAEQLARMGYLRVDVAEERGQFAVRGGILDVFPSDASYPVRVELFGDDIETLKRYVPTTGQTIGDTASVEVFPCRDIMLGTRAAQSIRRALDAKARENEALAFDLERVDEGIYFNGVERFLPHIYKSAGAVLDYVPPSALVVVAEPRSLFDDAAHYSDDVIALAKTAGVDASGSSSRRLRSTWGRASASRSSRCCVRVARSTARSRRAGPTLPAARTPSWAACARLLSSGYEVVVARATTVRAARCATCSPPLAPRSSTWRPSRAPWSAPAPSRSLRPTSPRASSSPARVWPS